MDSEGSGSRWTGLVLLLAALIVTPWSIPFEHRAALAAWLAPVLLLLIARGFRAPVGLPVAGLILIAGTFVASEGLLTGSARAIFVVLFGLVLLAPYGVDALIANRLSPTLRTLPFPLAMTAIDALLPRFAPLAAWGSPAYAHVDELVLAQLAALTGMAGITFFVAWTAAIAVDAIGGLRLRRRLPRVVLAWAVVAAGVAVFGSARLATAPAAPATIRVAGVTPDDPDLARTALRPPFEAALARLEARTWREADAGAQIVVWNEQAGQAPVDDQRLVLDRAAALAQTAHIYLLASYVVALRSNNLPISQNRAALFAPNGRRLFDAAQAHPIPVVATPLGRLATVIGDDADVPAFVAQAGRAQADVLLDPAFDPPGIRTMHAQMARLRAIEDGAALFRITSRAQSLASDPYGRIIATATDDASDGTLVAMLPARRAFVLAPWTIDLAGPLALAALIVIALIAAAGVRGRAVSPPSE